MKGLEMELEFEKELELKGYWNPYYIEIQISE